MQSLSRALLSTLSLAVVLATTADAAELRGSLSSMRKQHQIAVTRDLEFAKTAGQVRALVDEGVLQRVTESENVELTPLSYPYARPEVKLFIDRLGAQYHDAFGVPLVVTSLLRPIEEQPANAHRLSVHPAGMALDLRVPAAAAQRQWIESTLLSLENAGVLDVTRERHPPHYHVAIYPQAYTAYAARLDSTRLTRALNALGGVEIITLKAGERVAIARAGLTPLFSASLGGLAGAAVLLLGGLSLGRAAARRRDR